MSCMSRRGNAHVTPSHEQLALVNAGGGGGAAAAAYAHATVNICIDASLNALLV
jgi:hypothetical protein